MYRGHVPRDHSFSQFLALRHEVSFVNHDEIEQVVLSLLYTFQSVLEQEVRT